MLEEEYGDADFREEEPEEDEKDEEEEAEELLLNLLPGWLDRIELNPYKWTPGKNMCLDWNTEAECIRADCTWNRGRFGCHKTK